MAIIRRFDRRAAGGRILYISGATLLQAERANSPTYLELVDAMRSKSADFVGDVQALWKRLVFNLLVTNVDDHLHHVGYLYVGQNPWCLAPAFDINPLPDTDRESRTILSEETGPITSVDRLLESAPRFELKPRQSRQAMAQVVGAVQRWCEVAQSLAVGMAKNELPAFADAFERDQLEAARRTSAL